MTTSLYYEQDGRDFYCKDPIDHNKTVEVWTAHTDLVGDTLENAMVWRDMFIAYHVNRGFLPILISPFA